MGHLHDVKREYLNLQRRLDQGPARLPRQRAIFQVLSMLFTEDEARIGAAMPWTPISARRLAGLVDMPEAAVTAHLDRMADKGLVFDFLSPKSGRYKYVLAPPVVGFMEFTMMRVRDDYDQKAMAGLLYEYMVEDRSFADAVFAPGDAQIGRTLVHEDALVEGDFAEVLDWEKASWLIEEAGGGALSLCYCRHKGEHLGHPCEHPVDNCTSLYPAADYIIRHQMGRRAEASEMKEVLAQARERGLVQIADNVQKRPMYICHCCGCHCAQLLAITRFGLKQAVRTSSRIAEVDARNCTGCMRCVKRCPVGALSVVKVAGELGQKGKLVAQVDTSICLGCGVCHAACRHEALAFPARKQRILTPESTIERILMRAAEYGSVHHMLLGAEENLSMAFLHRLLGVVERLPPVRRAMLNRQIKSRFVAALSSGGRKMGIRDPSMDASGR